MMSRVRAAQHYGTTACSCRAGDLAGSGSGGVRRQEVRNSGMRLADEGTASE
jgi:hypothetical protein